MFLKSANSDIENGFYKKFKNVPRKKSYTAETRKWKRQVLKDTR